MSIIFPKILSIENFGYWQLFLFYSSFVGFFHFGLNDGIYLRYGGKDIKKVNGELLKVQFFILFAIQLFLFVAIFAYQYFNGRQDLILIAFCVLILMIINNLTSYLTSFFQAVNKLTFFSNTTIINSLSFLVLILVLLYFDLLSLYHIILVYLISYSIGMFYAIYKAREIFSVKINWINKFAFINQFKTNIIAGFFLMISAISGMLIIGVGRFLIEKKWGVVTFAVVSLSFTITTFMLFFVRQLGIVFFPLLKKAHADQQKKYFKLSITFINVLLLGCLLFVPIINYTVIELLPKYSKSLVFFTLIVPMIIYEGKMQIVLNTYMKAKRKERQLMYINILSLILSAIFCIVGYYMESINFIILAMTLATMLKGVALEFYLNKMMKISNINSIILVFLISVLFIYLFRSFSFLIAWILYLCAYVGYILLNFSNLKEIKKELIKS